MNVWFGDPSRPVGVSTPDGDIAREVAGLFRPLLLPGHAGGEPDIHLRRTGKGFRLVEPASGEAPRQFYGLPRALARLEYRVVLLLQGRWADHAFLHGAGLDLGGEALLWMGPSGAGKSSLTLAASLAGWKVLGDDCLMVDAHARVRGIPRLLKVVGPQLKRMALEKGGTVLPHPEVSEVWWDPARSGGWAEGAYPVHAVARIAWVRETGPPRLAPMSASEGVRFLLDNLLPAGLSPAASLDRLLGVARAARFVDLRFHEAKRGLEALTAWAGATQG